MATAITRSMRRRHAGWVHAALVGLLLAANAVAGQVSHDLHIVLDPGSRQLRAHDRLSLPGEYRAGHATAVSFLLDARLQPACIEADGTLRPLKPFDALGEFGHFYVTLPPQAKGFSLSYAGKLPTAPGEAAGISLNRDDFWYPVIGNDLVTFSLQVTLPPGWTAVSQGSRSEHRVEDNGGTTVLWRSDTPQEQIWLIADRFNEYRRKTDATDVFAFLRTPDPELADRYLRAAERYLSMYSRLLGPYPYEKFALIESDRQSGDARPSFTVIGSRVLRLPHLVDSAYPHEILHNWFGNGVYPDFESGNWSEGLVTYLSDHLFAEQRGEGGRFRREALWKYRNSVDEASEPPLREFHMRHDGISEGIGYHKALMFFHSLRRQLGDAEFLSALRDFYSRKRFKIAAWEDLRLSMQQASGQDLGPLFAHWLGQTGAPSLAVKNVSVQPAGNAFRVSGVLVQEPAPVANRFLRLPAVVTYAGSGEPLHAIIETAQAQQPFAFTVPGRPLLLQIDPDFDVFRRLAEEEFPATIGEAFEAARLTLVTASSASPQASARHNRLIAALMQRFPHIQRVRDIDLATLPDQGAVWLLGWENRFLPAMAAALRAEAQLDDGALHIAGSTYRRDMATALVSARRPTDAGPQPLLWMGGDNPAAAEAMALRLMPHGSYSYLIFPHRETADLVIGEWPTRSSALCIVLADAAPTQPARPARPPLIGASESR